MFTERILVPHLRLFSRLRCVFGGIHTSHPSVERWRIVAPLHACRREFAAFVCAVMVTLPQTAYGVPAVGIDPAAEQLQQIGDVASIFSCLGSGEPWQR